jgi:hypothetical protein
MLGFAGNLTEAVAADFSVTKERAGKSSNALILATHRQGHDQKF